MEFLQKIPAKQQENQRYVTIVEDDQGISSQQEQGSTEVRRPLTFKLPLLPLKILMEIRSNRENSGVDLKQRYINRI